MAFSPKILDLRQLFFYFDAKLRPEYSVLEVYADLFWVVGIFLRDLEVLFLVGRSLAGNSRNIFSG